LLIEEGIDVIIKITDYHIHPALGRYKFMEDFLHRLRKIKTFRRIIIFKDNYIAIKDSDFNMASYEKF
jgi:hypothetical protein